MSAATRALADKIEALDATLSEIAANKTLLTNYKAEKQRYSALVDEVQTAQDALLTTSEAQLKELRDALNTAYPTP